MFETIHQRASPRIKFSCLAHFRSQNAEPGDLERLCVTKDFSHDGLYFLADERALRENMLLLLRFPYNLRPSVKSREYLVEVMRINSLPQGRCGVGARLVLGIPVKLQDGLFVPQTDSSKHIWPHTASQHIDLYG
jgi:hypothetical protein